MNDTSSIISSASSVTSSVTSYLRGLLMTVLLGSLQAYKLLISPLLGSRCRFHPSCSVYAQASLRRFGVVRGGWLAARRLARCGPWHEGGIDPVPERAANGQCADQCPSHCKTTDHDPIIQAVVNRTRA